MVRDAKYERKLSAAQIRRNARMRFVQARKVERSYQRQLVHIANHVGHLVKAFAPKGVVTNMSGLTSALVRYSDALRPWAHAVSFKMQTAVAQRDEHAWAELGRSVGRALRNEIQKAPTGQALRSRMAEQVDLITSLPLDAARRVHHLTIQGVAESKRASEIQKQILLTGHVTLGRAKLIARTEVSRTASVLTETRSRHIGSEGYIWRTSKDTDVRDRHRELEGKFIRWDDPPVAGERGERAHAGAIYNCRCYPEPVIPDSLRLAA